MNNESQKTELNNTHTEKLTIQPTTTNIWILTIGVCFLGAVYLITTKDKETSLKLNFGKINLETKSQPVSTRFRQKLYLTTKKYHLMIFRQKIHQT